MLTWPVRKQNFNFDRMFCGTYSRPALNRHTSISDSLMSCLTIVSKRLIVSIKYIFLCLFLFQLQEEYFLLTDRSDCREHTELGVSDLSPSARASGTSSEPHTRTARTLNCSLFKLTLWCVRKPCHKFLFLKLLLSV